MSEEATTPDLVELSRRLREAANRRDFNAMLSFFARDAVLENAEGLGTFEGKEAIRGFWQDWFASFEEQEVERDEALDLGNGVVFGVLITRARIAGSSGEVRQRTGVVGEWADGLILRMTLYTDIDKARAHAERLAAERR